MCSDWIRTDSSFLCGRGARLGQVWETYKAAWGWSESGSSTQGQTPRSLPHMSSPTAELSGQPARPQSERPGQMSRNLVKGTEKVGEAQARPEEGVGEELFFWAGNDFSLSTDRVHQ